MAYSTSSLESFSIPLGIRAHQLAQQSRSHHAQPDKAKQTYLNTLAAVAVQNYLAMMGYHSELGDVGEPIQQTLLDCADLVVPGYGRVECRYCLASDDTIHVPPDVWDDRLGFFFVQLEDSLREAQILGLAQTVTQKQFPRSEVSPLENLSSLLTPQESWVDGVQPVLTQLSRWFQGAQDSWQLMQQSLDLFLATPDLAYRSQPEIESLSPELGRSKLITLTSHNRPLDLSIFMGLRSLPSSDTDVWVKVSGIGQSLPTQLRMSILTPEETEVMSAQSNGTEAMQFRFSASSGEQFRLQLSLEEEVWHEDFRL